MFCSVISSKLWTICFVNMLTFGQIHASLDYDQFKYKNNAIDQQTLDHCLQTLQTTVHPDVKELYCLYIGYCMSVVT